MKKILDKLRNNSVELTLNEKIKVVNYILRRLTIKKEFICHVLDINYITQFEYSFPELYSVIEPYILVTAIHYIEIQKAYGIKVTDKGYVKAKKMLLRDLLIKLKEQL